MINLTILAIFLAALILSRGRLEGTCKLPGILAGLTFVERGRVRAMVWSHRPGRVYYRVSLTGRV